MMRSSSIKSGQRANMRGYRRRAAARRVLIVPLGVFFIAAFAGGVQSADVTITATLQPQTVAVGEQATLLVSVQGKFRKSGGPELPVMPDFDVYEAGSSQNFSMINGAISSSVNFSYIIVPRKEGRFTIEPIRYTVEDKIYTATPVTLDVVKGQTAITSRPAAPQTEGGTEHGVQGKNLFIRATADRDTVYVNQQVTWALGFFTDGRVRLMQSPNYYAPESEGFWEEDLPPVNKFYSTIDNTRYLVNEVKRAYFPTAPGVFIIGSARVEVMTDDWDSSTSDNFFRRPLRSFGFGTPKTLSTDPVTITVLPLPQAGKPAGFTGIVASGLRVDLKADKQTAQVGEPVNVTLNIAGRGNMKTIAAPALTDIAGFKIYESGSSSEISKDNYVVSGKKKYEYVFVPKVEGSKQIPAVELSYFDPEQRRYRTVATSPIHLEVNPGVHEDGRRIVFAGGEDQIEVLARDIKYIHPVPSVLAVNAPRLHDSKRYGILHVVPLLAVLFALAGERRSRRWRDNYQLARSERAAREAQKKLASAEKALKQGDVEGLFSMISAAIWNYLADKMNVSPAGLTVESAQAFLAGRSVGEDELARLQRVLAACDAAKYSAGDAREDQAGEVLKSALQLVKSLDKRYPC
ncbi:MAG: BatD family protein [Candidatus Latescibacterota bacterium]